MIFSDKEIEKWNQTYDTLKYPTKIYDELVWDAKKHPRKIELMGAWKTGSLRIDNSTQQPEYIDENNSQYKYTKRWKLETPVGYSVWKKISKDIDVFKAKIPNKLENKKPEILLKLEEMNGFGFIWAIFVLHCIKPNIFPLYDQHVYRAYKYIESAEIELPKKAPSSWCEYCQYAQFFNKLVDNSTFEKKVVDRALWSYGKYIKSNFSSIKIENDTINKKRVSNYLDKEEDLCHLTTLGGKAKKFWWKINDDFSLSIIREFNDKTGKKKLQVFSESQINKIQKYISNKKVPLANSVTKLRNGTEKDGLGKFIYTEFNWTGTETQTASQLASIFIHSNIWDYNKKLRDMIFWEKSDDWKNRLEQFYLSCIESEKY